MRRYKWHNLVKIRTLLAEEKGRIPPLRERAEGTPAMSEQAQKFWTHPSVLGLARGRNPIEAVVEGARKMLLSAMESGWSGPPFDPFTLAEHLSIPVLAKDDINDARMVPAPHGARIQIEYNPNRPRARVRYSIAHEIAHTLFPDCRDRVRQRLARAHMQADDWQLEMLCNIAASEILMPVGSFPELAEETLSIDQLVSLRVRYEVSIEALLLRFARLTHLPCLVFAASRREDDPDRDRYQVDYTVSPTTWVYPIENGALLPAQTGIRGCTAIGYTAVFDEEWAGGAGDIHIEAVGIAPYPTRSFPRVVGFAAPRKRRIPSIPRITYLAGDATQPRGSGAKLIIHIVNDRTPRWGGGFARVVRATWPEVQKEFIEWAEAPARLHLGTCHTSPITDKLAVVSMVCQHGYGPSPKPRIRYNALEECLNEVATIATERKASIHMPRIGCGQAGGSWDVVEELIEQALIRRGISVTVYDLPHVGQGAPSNRPTLFPI